jgi:glycopeptide antibiotics resistance protein
MSLFIFLIMLRFIPGVVWLIIITILFVLPGNEFPDETWFEKVYLDKWVHTFFFFVLIYLFYIPLGDPQTRWLKRITLCGILYGVLIEVIQHYLAVGRSFDIVDIVFDAIGCIGAYFFWQKAGKKISPCGNRGRNQN